MLLNGLTILGLAFVQNISFSLVSRSRNRDNISYHLIAAVLSNSLYFLTFKELMKTEFDLNMIFFYVTGTVAGSILGVKISMFIERLLGATADGHVKNNQKNGRKENNQNKLH